MTESTGISVFGAGGRMGRGLLSEVLTHTNARLVGALEHDEHPQLGRDVVKGAPSLSADLDTALADSDVIIDFSSPAGTVRVAEAAAVAGVALVTGTTGLTEEQQDRVIELAGTIPVVASPNMSVGVNALLGLVFRAARALEDWDAEVHEIHHSAKKDAPSGTALAIAEAIAAGRDLSHDHIRTSRTGFAPRLLDEIGVMASRGGDVVGEHTTFFFGLGERLELTHRATDRRIFVRGAVRAALWVVGKAPGLYSMQDVLFGEDSPTENP